MNLNTKRLLLLTLALEGSLFIAFLIWNEFRPFPYRLSPSTTDIFDGALLTLPLFFANYLLFGKRTERFCGHFRAIQKCAQFRDELVKPLCDQLPIFAALFVSIGAGIGEEFFFRGILQTEFGLIAASVLFSVLHFGPAVREFWVLAIIYAVIGGYFGFAMKFYQSIWTVIFAHGFYDFGAIVYMHYFYSPSIQTGD